MVAPRQPDRRLLDLIRREGRGLGEGVVRLAELCVELHRAEHAEDVQAEERRMLLGEPPADPADDAPIREGGRP